MNSMFTLYVKNRSIFVNQYEILDFYPCACIETDEKTMLKLICSTYERIQAVMGLGNTSHWKVTRNIQLPYETLRNIRNLKMVSYEGSRYREMTLSHYFYSLHR